MKSFVLYFILFFFSLPGSILYSQNSSNSSYYPLRMGNQWEYDNEYFPLTEKIIDTTTFKGLFYYGLTSWSDQVEFWLREDSNKVHLFNMSDSTDFILFDFSADTGKSWELPPGYECSFGTEITLKSKDDSIITSTTTFTNCYFFKHKPACFDAGIEDTWFAKGAGKVRWREITIAGMIEYNLKNFTTTPIIKSERISSLIDSYRLYQNYPNPFNPSTTIEFDLPKSSNVILKIYNILGEEVTRLISNRLSTGSYSYDWDASGMASGLYLYRLKAGEYVDTKKMILLE